VKRERASGGGHWGVEKRGERTGEMRERRRREEKGGEKEVERRRE
jgi:hypothetical protein